MNRFSRTLGVFASGCVVYFIMAACSSVADRGSSIPPPPDGVAPIATAAPTTPSPGPSPTSPVPPAMADDWYVPGVRLKVMYIAGADGSKQFRSWWDTKRDEACTFAEYADASFRCTPTIEKSADVLSEVGNVWASLDCTGSLLVITTKGTIPPKNVQAGKLIFTVGLGTYDGAASVGYPSSCSTVVPAGDRRVITPVPGADFVGGSLKVAL